MATLPIAEFLTSRLKEYDFTFELRSGTGFESLFFKPVQFMTQPLRDEADNIFIAQSFRRILQTEAPDDFDEEAVDALANNIFVYRAEGSYSSGVVRLYYGTPVDREWPSNGINLTGSNGLTYTNPAPYAVSVAQTGSQIENGLYYYDIAVQCTEKGSAGDLEVGGIVSISNDSLALSVTNKAAIKGGVSRETNTEFIERTRQSIGVRDLVTGKGINAILFEQFAGQITEIQSVGLGDPEMMRDILFNTHVGGKVDIYFKTPTVQIGEKYFQGLLIDTTRQAYASANVILSGIAGQSVRNINLDRSNGKAPIVTEIKPSEKAIFYGTADLSSPVDLSDNQHIRIGVGGNLKTMRVAGVNPAQTSRNEIVNLINASYGVKIAFSWNLGIMIVDPTPGLSSQVVIDFPEVGSSAAEIIFGLPDSLLPSLTEGDGPVTYAEGVHYTIDDGAGKISRVLGQILPTPTMTGETVAGTAGFTDSTPYAFTQVAERDIVTILSGNEIGDYRVIQKVDDNNLILDADFLEDASGIQYNIRRTGIKDGERVYAQYWYNPLSIDIGKLVKLDQYGRERGIRTGRENHTITDLAFLRIRKIELVDPITYEPLDEILKGGGGFGFGGFGEGPFGIGNSADYRLIVNSPNDRFSMWEDSYIVIDTSYQGMSFRVEYEYVPEVEALHEFCRSEVERVMDGDILMRHFIPAYVSGTIQYSIDETDISIPSNEELQLLVREFISGRKSGERLDYTDIHQYILTVTDPYRKYGTSIKKFKLTSKIHNADGSLTVATGDDYIDIPVTDPFPKDTTRPLSPRISHWIADDLDGSGLLLERISR